MSLFMQRNQYQPIDQEVTRQRQGGLLTFPLRSICPLSYEARTSAFFLNHLINRLFVERQMVVRQVQQFWALESFLSDLKLSSTFLRSLFALRDSFTPQPITLAVDFSTKTR